VAVMGSNIAGSIGIDLECVRGEGRSTGAALPGKGVPALPGTGVTALLGDGGAALPGTSGIALPGDGGAMP